MTGIQAFATTPIAMTDLDPYRFPAAFIDDRQDEMSMARVSLPFGDYGLTAATPAPAPSPSSNLSDSLQPADRRRLELHAALTTAGIAPSPGDRDAIEALCTLDDTTHVALRRWLSRFDNL
ncbi:hypothetical protein [Streptomyces sp. NPDC051921]|uniref:hypothetical protein n=1 Tax=Streptomyces sp. NPDC051921 TaxID=3155806 RepID=UPI0034456BAA